MREYVIQGTYLAAAALFILGLRGLTRPEAARRGINLAAVGMLLAVIGTLLQAQIVDYRWIALGLAVGTIIGIPLGTRVPMTAMPQRIAIALMFGATAATLVGVAEYHTSGATFSAVRMVALNFEVLLGALTITGSFMAFGKLQEFIPGRPVTFRGQNAVNLVLFALAIYHFGYLVVHPGATSVFYGMIGLAGVLGVLFVLPIGGADMPVVVALLNSYAGLASCATGFMIGNNILIVAGALDGASGFILSLLMSKAMNRSFTNVLFGAFGAEVATGGAGAAGGADRAVRTISAEDAAVQLAYARFVIIIPGYGMAGAQAQHDVRELAEAIEKRGGAVKYAIHPVAGRMPGHMNVLLAEANVPYDKLYDMDDINPEFARADVALVIGANDVVNPAARTDPQSPLYGMPILDVDHAKSVIVIKRSMAAGFAGVDNALYYADRTAMLFGDAKKMLHALVTEVAKL